MIFLKEITTVSLILFAVIDILGSVPILVDIKQKVGRIRSFTATITAGTIMILFLLTGDQLLSLIGIDVASFAVAGSIVIFLMGLEMILGINIFKSEDVDPKSASIMPIAFPLIAGSGTLTTILSLRSEYDYSVIAVSIFINLSIVFLVLKGLPFIEKILGKQGIEVLRRIFGIILLAIAIKLFKTNVVL